MKRWTVVCLVFLVGCLVYGVGLAGIYSESVMYTSKSPDKQTVTKMYIEGDNVRSGHRLQIRPGT